MQTDHIGILENKTDRWDPQCIYTSISSKTYIHIYFAIFISLTAPMTRRRRRRQVVRLRRSSPWRRQQVAVWKSQSYQAKQPSKSIVVWSELRWRCSLISHSLHLLPCPSLHLLLYPLPPASPTYLTKRKKENQRGQLSKWVTVHPQREREREGRDRHPPGLSSLINSYGAYA